MPHSIDGSTRRPSDNRRLAGQFVDPRQPAAAAGHQVASPRIGPARELILDHFAARTVSGCIVEELLDNVGRLTDRTRARGLSDYLETAREIVGFSPRLRLAHFLHRRFGVDAAGQSIKLARGDFFGEMALLLAQPRQADVTAVSYCLLLVLEDDDFQALLKGSKGIRARIDAAALARRRMNEALQQS